MLPICVLARCGDLLRNFKYDRNEMAGRPVWSQSPLDVLISSLPVYLFFTTYMQICLLWYYLPKMKSHGVHSRTKGLVVISVLINLFVYLCWISFIVAFFLTAKKIVHTIETIFSTVLSVSAGMASLFFGVRLYIRLQNSLSHEKKTITRKILATTVICTFVFLFRAVLIALTYFFFSAQIQIVIFNLIWWALIEIIPVLAITIVMNSGKPVSKVAKVKGKKINSHTGHESSPLITNDFFP